jgi:hypothetical protein
VHADLVAPFGLEPALDQRAAGAALAQRIVRDGAMAAADHRAHRATLLDQPRLDHAGGGRRRARDQRQIDAPVEAARRGANSPSHPI